MRILISKTGRSLASICANLTADDSPLHRGILRTACANGCWIRASGSRGCNRNIEPALDAAHVTLPADLEARKADPAGRLGDVQAQRGRNSANGRQGYAAVGLKRDAAGAAYVLAPWSDF